ncbi:MAG: tryptophan--tRNA ligase [Patescibacteria group bacterium]
MAKKRVLSGVQPSGNLTIGNYIGAISQWVKKQGEVNTENWFFVVDLHAMTVPYDPETLKKRTLEIIMIYLACGIDPAKSNLFIQSHVPAHTELTWILNCNTPIGWMNQMIQFKEKSRKVGDDNVSVGLMDYPVLQAADILLYNTDEVPVGDDQRQHVEIAREIARRFNRLYGETFKEPKAVNPPSGARIMALDNPAEKMSKSAKSKYNYIWLLDTADDIRAKIGKAVTDSGKEIVFDAKRPALHNLLTIYQNITGEEKQVIEDRFAGKGYAEFKEELAERVVDFINPIREKYGELDKNRDYVIEVLARGAARANEVASMTLAKARKRAGLIEPFLAQDLKVKPVISFDDWLKLDINIGEIKRVEEVEGADKLYKLTIDFGDKGETEIISGIREFFEPEDLVGKQVPILRNLAPKEIRGIQSRGMILAVDNDGAAVLLNPGQPVKLGSIIS